MCCKCQVIQSKSAHGKISIYNLSRLRQPFGRQLSRRGLAVNRRSELVKDIAREDW
jgi:hypothetical protein